MFHFSRLKFGDERYLAPRSRNQPKWPQIRKLCNHVAAFVPCASDKISGTP